MWNKIKTSLLNIENAILAWCVAHMAHSRVGIYFTTAILIAFIVIHYRQTLVKSLINKAKALLEKRKSEDEALKKVEDEANKSADDLVKQTQTDAEVKDDWYKNQK